MTLESPGETAVEIEEILLLHHSHLDLGYTHSQPILWELQLEFITQAVDWLELTSELPMDSRPKWTCEVSEPLRRWLARASPDQIERFRSLHKQGRIGIAALRWHSGASVDRAGLRRLLDGKEELEQVLETTVHVACQHDVNGVPWPLADVLLDAGIDLFVMAINPHLGRAVRPRPGMFMWEAPSGRALRVFNGHAYTMFDQLLLAWDDSVERMAEGWEVLEQRLQDTGYPYRFLYLTSTCAPVMWDNSPPNPFMPSLIERWNDSGCGPKVRYATFDDLRERASRRARRRARSLRGDWTDYWSLGYGSTPIATALNRRAKPLLDAASRLGKGQRQDVVDRAAERIDLFDEHTFSYWDTTDDHPQAQTIETLKQALAHEGYELAALALMQELERVAGNAVADRRIEGVLLCNTGPRSLAVHPALPEAWFETSPSIDRTYRAARMTYDGRSWENSFPGRRSRSFGAVELPPHSWKIVPLERLAAPETSSDLSHRLEVAAPATSDAGLAVASGHHRLKGTIESAFYLLSYDAESGRILSLIDRVQDRELLAPRDGLDFFAFIRERTDELDEGRRYAFYQRELDREMVDDSCWQDWSPIRERATSTVRCDVHESAREICLERVLAAPGVRHLGQRIVLCADDPVIRLEADFELEPDASPQAVYFAFPLACGAGWDAVYDTAGQIVQLDEDQLPGACRNWVAVNSLASIGDAAGAVALLCPDAPLVQFGDFHFGPPLDAVPRDENPLLLAWAVNNYWETNFPRVQRGRIRLRYGFSSLAALKADVLVECADRFRHAPLIWPVTTADGVSTGSLMIPQP